MSPGQVNWWRGRVRAVRERGPMVAQLAEVADERNGLERLYGDHLELLRLAGQIRWYRFGDTSLRLARRTWYRLDYRVGAPDGVQEIHEVKGHWEDDARVKIKVAARLFPEFRFIAVMNAGSKKRPVWDVEAVQP